MNTTLYIGNLSFDSTQEDLTDYFSSQGIETTEVNVIFDKMSGRPRGFAFVKVADEEAAKKAIEQMDQQEFMGRNLIVREAYDSNTQGDKKPFRSGGGNRGGGGRGGNFRGDRRQRDQY